MLITVHKSEIKAAMDQYKEFLAGRSGGFTAGLFELISQADIGNKRKLALAFPAHVYVYMHLAGELDQINYIVKEI